MLEKLYAEREQQMRLSVRQPPSLPPSETQSTLPRHLAGFEINPAAVLAAIVIMVCYHTRHSQSDVSQTPRKKKKKNKKVDPQKTEETEQAPAS